MPRGIKGRDVNYSMKELLQDTGLQKKAFDDLFRRLIEMFDLKDLVNSKVNRFKKAKDPDADYEFGFEWYNLFKAIITTVQKHPFYRKNRNIHNITTEHILDYYNAVLDAIDGMPDSLRNEIVGHVAYENVVTESLLLPDFSSKLTEFITGLQMITEQERPDILATVYRQLDEWTFNAFKHHYVLSIAKRSNEKYMSGYKDSVKGSGDSEAVLEMIADDERQSERATVPEIDKLLVDVLRDRITTFGVDDEPDIKSYLDMYGPWDDLPLDSTRLVYQSAYDAPYMESIEELETRLEKLRTPSWRLKSEECKAIERLDKSSKLSDEDKRKQRAEQKNTYIRQLRTKIDELTDELKRVEQEEDFLAKETELEERMLRDYIAFCGHVREESKSKLDMADSFTARIVTENLVRE